MSRLDNPNNPCIERLKNAVDLFLKSKNGTLYLMASFEVKPWGLYEGTVSTLEPKP